METILPSSSSYATTIDEEFSPGSSTPKGKNYLSPTDLYYPEASGSSFSDLVESSTRPYRPTEFERTVAVVAAAKGKVPTELQLHEEEDEEDDWDDLEDPDDIRYVNFSLLSHIAVRLRDKVPRGTHVKGSIPYPRAFTGKDIVVSPYI
jgi:hypothetical protein